MSDRESQGARLRMRILGAFTPTPSGRVFSLSPTTLAQTMTEASLTCVARVADRLGAGGTREIALSFTSPRSFQIREVVSSCPPLAALRALADDLGGDASRAPSAAAAIQRVEEIVGRGALTSALATAFGIGGEPSRTEKLAQGGHADTPNVDAILAQGILPAKTSSTVAGAVDALVRTMRGSHPGAGPPKGARAARAALEEAVYLTAADALRDPLVARLEGAWRGLKLLLDQCPEASSTAIEVIDVAPEGLLAALDADLPEDPVDRPDLFVIVDPCDDLALLSRLADAGERLLAPVLVAVSPQLFGVEAPEVSTEVEKEGGGLPEAWGALRAEEATRWLCVATNRAVVASEGVGAARRTAFTSPSLVLAAMLAASFRDTRSFARITGGPGALDTGASWEPPSPRDAGVSIPTEAFFSLRAQAALARHGILGLGSARNSTKVMLSELPMVRAAADAAPLPAQILTGRIVRFAQWVARTVPSDASDRDAALLFEEAAKVFLFAGLDEGTASLRAGVGKDAQGTRTVEVACALHARHAGVPFQMAFALPLGA